MEGGGGGGWDQNKWRERETDQWTGRKRVDEENGEESSWSLTSHQPHMITYGREREAGEGGGGGVDEESSGESSYFNVPSTARCRPRREGWGGGGGGANTGTDTCLLWRPPAHTQGWRRGGGRVLSMHSLLNAHDYCPISNPRQRNNFPSFFNHCAVQMCSALTAQ